MNTVWCLRAKGAHALARRIETPAGAEVVAQVPTPSRQGYTVHPRTFTTSDLAHDWDGDTTPLARLDVGVACRCGQYVVDVAALLRGEPVVVDPSPLSAQEERGYGVRPERRRR